jgi:hypothetical protein
MKSAFRATSPEDLERVRSFLCSVFRVGPDEPFVQRALMEWKYWRPRPDWSGSRSYVLERKDRLVAHGCAWPIPLRSGTARRRAVHLIDWAADPTVLGAGSLLIDRLMTVAECVISVGGSEMTRRILPKIGFSPAGQFRTFARPLRPFRQFLSHQYRNWKLPLRLARNLAWSLSGARVPTGWRSRAAVPDEIPADAMPQPHSEVFVPSRDVPFHKYLLTSEAVPYRIYTVHRADQLEGYFCLSLVPGQARVAEMRMKSSDPAEWAIGYALASREATDLGAVEILAGSSSQVGWEALRLAGYQLRGSEPILCRLARGTPPPILELEMVDGDAFFLHRRRPAYLT